MGATFTIAPLPEKVPGTWVLMFRLISKKVPGIGAGSDDFDDLCEWPVSCKRPRIVRIV